MRKIILATNYHYHVFNRGVEKRPIFTNKREYQRALETIKYYRFASPPLRFSKFLVQPKDKKIELLNRMNFSQNKLVEIISYCLMPNHFHFLLKQVQENGISKFISNFTNSYTKYFNTKHEREGHLLQGIFKAILVETDEQLIHLSRYIHLNPITSLLIKKTDLEAYSWSSLPKYLNLNSDSFCENKTVMNLFSSVSDYKNFIFDDIKYAQELEKIKHLTLEE